MAEVSAELSTDSENVRPQSDNTSSDNVADNTSEEVTFWTVSGNEIFNVDVLQDSEGMETEKTTNNEKSIDNNDITENSKDNNATPEKSNDNNNMPEKPDDSQSSEKDNTQSEDVLEENMDPHVRDSTPETLSADESDCNNVSPVGLLQSKSSPNFSIYKKDPAVKAVKQSRLDAISQRLTQLQSGEKKQPEESENFKVPSDLPPGTIVVEPAEVPMDMDQGRPLSGNSKIDVSVTPSLNASNVDGGNTDKNADSVVNDSVSKETDKSEQETSKHDNTVKDNQVTEKEIISSSGNTTEETKKKGWADMVDDYSDLAAAYGLGSNLNDSTVDKGDMAGALSSSISHPLTVQTSSASQMGMNLPVTANSGVGYISVPQLYGHSNSTASALFPSPVQLQPPPQQLLTTAQNQLLSALQAPPAIYNPKIPNSTVIPRDGEPKS
uniref:Myb-like protein X-like n=1 Tax=Saccoglossus kowalevskii TaxID=10224 RepID=A0ABM0GQJ4_SACKO|nr:PREDICTED: myb-like protein X-like [Saccoglossus kowalevskii]